MPVHHGRQGEVGDRSAPPVARVSDEQTPPTGLEGTVEHQWP